MERVLDLLHLGHKICGFDNFFQGVVHVPASQDQVKMRLLFADDLDLREHKIDIEKAVAQHVEKLIEDQLPEALDFLARILRAGHSLATALQMAAEELPDPLAAEFRRCYDQHSLGAPLESALKDMVTRVESTDFAFFVTAILIQRQTGGDLSEVLNNISAMIRQRIRLQQHVKAKTAEGRFTGYILVAFPAVMFVIVNMLNPDYGNVLLKTSTGQWLLATAFGLQMSGLFAIRKVTSIKI